MGFGVWGVGVEGQGLRVWRYNWVREVNGPVTKSHVEAHSVSTCAGDGFQGL